MAIETKNESAGQFLEVTTRGECCEMLFQGMGTSNRVIFTVPSHARAASFKSEILSWVNRFEQRYSRYRSDSIISEINHGAGGTAPVAIDAELRDMLALCDWFHWMTRGIFDPTALPLLQIWDFKAEHLVLPPPDAIFRAMALVGWRRVIRTNHTIMLPESGMGIDLGGIGKEYAVDHVVEMAKAVGIRDLLVDFGQDIRVLGSPPQGGAWRIGLENPIDPSGCYRGIVIGDRAIATSGDYYRFFSANGKSYGHIIDVRTGYPVSNGVRSVSVIAPTCTEAGILSKTAFILGVEEGLKFLDATPQVEGCIWSEDGVYETRGLATYEIVA